MRDIGRAIDSTDLNAVRRKLTDAGWSVERWNAALRDYFRFLYLVGKYPDEIIVPWTTDLDEVWHAHILDTKKYAADCQRIFGRFIHHHPDLQGIGSPQEMKSRTQELFRAQFVTRGFSRTSAATIETQDNHFLLWLVVASSMDDSNPSRHESSHSHDGATPANAEFGHHDGDQPVEAGGDSGGSDGGAGDSGGGGDGGGGGGDGGGSSCGGGGGGGD